MRRRGTTLVPVVTAERLDCVAQRSIVPTQPFHFDGTFFNPSLLLSGDQRWELGRYWQTMRLGGNTYGLGLVAASAGRRTSIDLTVYSREPAAPAVVDAIVAELEWRFDLQSAAVPAFVAAFKRDAKVGSALRRRAGMRPASAYSLYEYLVITVMLQNTVVRRSVAMLQALFERYGSLVEFDGRSLWAFWSPEAIDSVPEDELRALKVGYRAKTLKRQADQFVRGAVDEHSLRREPDADALVARLDAIYGVGPQSAAYLLGELFHRYHRLDYVPPWEAKVFSHLLDLPNASPEDIRDLFHHTDQPYPHLAAYYLWTDLFWRHREKPLDWLAALIRL